MKDAQIPKSLDYGEETLKLILEVTQFLCEESGVMMSYENSSEIFRKIQFLIAAIICKKTKFTISERNSITGPLVLHQ